jgi:hypothetical protein
MSKISCGSEISHLHFITQIRVFLTCGCVKFVFVKLYYILLELCKFYIILTKYNAT